MGKVVVSVVAVVAVVLVTAFATVGVKKQAGMQAEPDERESG